MVFGKKKNKKEKKGGLKERLIRGSNEEKTENEQPKRFFSSKDPKIKSTRRSSGRIALNNDPRFRDLSFFHENGYTWDMAVVLPFGGGREESKDENGNRAPPMFSPKQV